MTDVRNPRWGDEAQTIIIVEALIGGEWVQFVASENDIEPHGVAIFEAATGGEFGTIGDYQLPPADAPPPAIEAVAIPDYPIADLPWAASNQNSLVIVTDDPQGIARSVPVGSEWHWLAEVDGSDLGAGNASS